jgi:diguanylate cyclase (GGDEF)-like protein
VRKNESRDAELQLQVIAKQIPGYIFRRVLKPGGKVEVSYSRGITNHLFRNPEVTTISEDEFFQHIHPDDVQAFIATTVRWRRDPSIIDEDFRMISLDGSLHWFHGHAEPRRLPNGDVVWDGVAFDITAQKMSEERTRYLAFHDSLTGLANRILLRDTAVEALGQNLSAKLPVAVFMIDLDGFQDINDVLGYGAGDIALRDIGHRLSVFASRFGGSAARVGGDEFGIVVANRDTSIASLARDICAEIAKEMNIPGAGTVVIRACVGAALCPFDGDPGDMTAADIYSDTLKRATLALRVAKLEGPGSYKEHEVDFEDTISNRRQIRQSLYQAIQQKQFQLHYQPIVDLASGQIVSAEALVRWKHPTLGFQRPDLFVPLAESSGLIEPLGAWIMKEAMCQYVAWRREGFPLGRLAINVSGAELKSANFVTMVEHALTQSGADPYHFELELTEGLLIDASTEILDVLRALKSMGFWISIDDFGTGYSSFKYIRNFQVDKIKIDQTFVRQLVTNSKDATIIRAMIYLSRNLGIDCTAEGIETPMQRDFLRVEGCPTGQGYLLGLPLEADEFRRSFSESLAPTLDKFRNPAFERHSVDR